MNAVEIADAVADLAAHPFEAAEFPFEFLAAFDKKEAQLKRLRKGDTNRSDVLGGVLLQSNTQGRLRVIYSNGTESNILLPSLQRALYEKHRNGRRVITPDFGPLFGNRFENGDQASGTIYVLRSLSHQPEIVAIREVLHKVGVTGCSVEDRIASAEKDATYILAPVEVVATWKLANIRHFRFEQIIHRIFASAQVQLRLADRFGIGVEPREWFVVPLPIIKQVIERIQDESIIDYIYDSSAGELRMIEKHGSSLNTSEIAGK